jgi:hypothetical protein
MAWWATPLTPAAGTVGVNAVATGTTGVTFDIVTRLAAGAVKLYVLSQC